MFREEIAKTVMKTFRTACDPWGITVERVEVGGSASAVWAYHDIVVRGHCHRAVYCISVGQCHDCIAQYTITLLTFPCPGEEPERGAGHGEEPRGGGPGQQGGQRSPHHAEGRGPQPGEN